MVRTLAVAGAALAAYLGWRAWSSRAAPRRAPETTTGARGASAKIDGRTLLLDPLPLETGVRYRYRFLESVFEPASFWGPRTTFFHAEADLPVDWPASLRHAESELTRWGESVWEGPSGPVGRVPGLLQVWRAP